MSNQPLTPGEEFGSALIAMLEERCGKSGVSQLQIALNPKTFSKSDPAAPYTHVVRIVIFDDTANAMALTKEQIVNRMENLKAEPFLDCGFAYVHNHVRVVVVPDQMTMERPAPKIKMPPKE